MVGIVKFSEMELFGVVMDTLIGIVDIIGWIGSLSIALQSVVAPVVNGELHNGSVFSGIRR